MSVTHKQLRQYWWASAVFVIIVTGLLIVIGVRAYKLSTELNAVHNAYAFALDEVTKKIEEQGLRSADLREEKEWVFNIELPDSFLGSNTHVSVLLNKTKNIVGDISISSTEWGLLISLERYKNEFPKHYRYNSGELFIGKGPEPLAEKLLACFRAAANSK